MLTAETVEAADPRSDERWFAGWRERELSRLDQAGLVYCDYAGAALPPASLIWADGARMAKGVLGNPHSEHRPSRAATDDLEAARAAILAFLNADAAEYGVVLTANATAASRLVGEGFPWGPKRPLVLAADNHNSVNGIAEHARRGGAEVTLVPLTEELRLPPLALVEECLHAAEGGLFAFPAQSNFSGVRHPLELIAAAQGAGHRVLLDAAALLSTGTLDLSAVHPDFVVLSIYKVTGYPTGLGALVARREALQELQRPWFAGGTVEWVSPALGRHLSRPGIERFEDGTANFLAAGAVAPALELIGAGRDGRLGRHLSRLTERLLREARESRHRGGASRLRIHGPRDGVDRGATIALTLVDPRGRALPFWEVEVAAREAGIALRGGCFCNPGCAERAFGLHPALLAPCLEALGKEFTIPRLSACLGGAPVGAVRIALGLGSVAADVERILELFDHLTSIPRSF